MADVLLLRLRAAPAADSTPASSILGGVDAPEAFAASWIVCNASGELIDPTREGSLREAAAAARGRRTVVLVPGSDVLQTEAELPARGGARVLQALPFALEEQLAEDVENLHFAPGERSASGTAAVHVVARSMMDAWTRELASAGVSADALYADASLMPANPGQLVLFLDGDDAHVMRSDGRRFAVPAADFVSLLDTVEPVTQSDDAPARHLLVFATQDDWQQNGRVFDSLRASGVTIKAQLLPQGPLPWLARQLSTSRAPNLLQGRYAPRGGISFDTRRWRLAAALVGAALALHLGAQAFRFDQQRRAEREATAMLNDALRPIFPGGAPAGDARRRVLAELARVRAGGGDVFLPAVDALATARRASPDVQIASIGYGASGLDVRLRASSPEGIERVRAALQGLGFDAVSQGGSSEGAIFNGRLRVQGAGGGR
jgi:general secretion pathway protein L